MNFPLSQIPLENYQQWLQIKNLSHRTIEEYSRYFLLLDQTQLSQEYMQDYLEKHHNQVARSFLNSYLSYIKLTNMPEQIQDMARKITIPKVSGRRKKTLPDVITESEIYTILKFMSLEKHKIILLISFYCGLRISELVGEYAIKPYSFQWTRWLNNPTEVGILKVSGKGNKQRLVMVQPTLMARIYRWITEEVAKTQKKEDNLFNIGDRRWRKVLELASKRALDKMINPHLLRHSCSIWLKQQGFDVNDRKEFLGHESISTTSIYDRVDTSALVKKYEKFSMNNPV